MKLGCFKFFGNKEWNNQLFDPPIIFESYKAIAAYIINEGIKHFSIKSFEQLEEAAKKQEITSDGWFKDNECESLFKAIGHYNNEEYELACKTFICMKQSIKDVTNAKFITTSDYKESELILREQKIQSFK